MSQMTVSFAVCPSVSYPAWCLHVTLLCLQLIAAATQTLIEQRTWKKLTFKTRNIMRCWISVVFWQTVLLLPLRPSCVQTPFSARGAHSLTAVEAGLVYWAQFLEVLVGSQWMTCAESQGCASAACRIQQNSFVCFFFLKKQNKTKKNNTTTTKKPNQPKKKPQGSVILLKQLLY